MIGPDATPEAPLTTIFQVRSSAPPSAFIGMTASFWPSGIAIPPARADARRVPGEIDRDRRLEARLADRADLQPHRAAPDQRHLGLDDLDRVRAFLGHGHRQAIDGRATRH